MFWLNVLKEINRKIIDLISDINLSYISKDSKRYLLSVEIRKKDIFFADLLMIKEINKNMYKT